MDRPDILPPDEYAFAVRTQVLVNLLNRAARELRHPLTATLFVTRDREIVRTVGVEASKGKGAPQIGQARVRFQETFITARLWFDLEARFAPDTRTPGFAGFATSGDVRDVGGAALEAAFRNWEIHRGPRHWSSDFESDDERATRLNVPVNWDLRELTAPVTGVQPLLDYLVRRYGLQGGLVATADGVMHASSGDLGACTNVGLAPILRADAVALEEWASRITLPLLPYSVTDGRWVVFVSRPTSTLFVVLVRLRPPAAEQPDAWGFLSEATQQAEGRIAEQMLHELREHLQQQGHILTR